MTFFFLPYIQLPNKLAAQTLIDLEHMIYPHCALYSVQQKEIYYAMIQGFFFPLCKGHIAGLFVLTELSWYQNIKQAPLSSRAL